MDGSENFLPNNIKPNNFPTKLWLLVNNPTVRAIQWDSRGENILINQKLFETEILRPGSVNSDEKLFITTNFSSFLRQLNLYGFKKGETRSGESTGESGTFQHFYNPRFQRDHPELLATLRRLTVDNKAKIRAGVAVSCRRQSHYQEMSAESSRDPKRRCTSLLMSPTHQQSPHACHDNEGQIRNVHCGTPVPPTSLMRDHRAGLPQNIFPAAREMPMSLSQYYTVAATNSNAMHIQQGLPIYSNPNVTSYNLTRTPHQPGYYPTGCRCCHPNLVSPYLIGLQKGLFSPQSYYQGGYPMTTAMFNPNQESQRKETKEANNSDINLDVVFQLADEMMPLSPNICVVETPEREDPVVGTSNTTVCENDCGDTKNTKPVSEGQGVWQQHEGSLVSKPEVSPVQVSDVLRSLREQQ